MILQGEIWRILSAHFVHLNLTHLSLNLLGFWLFLSLCGAHFTLKQLLSNICSISLGISALLLAFNPELLWYLGFSGVLYGLYIVGGLRLMSQGEYTLGGLIMLTIVSKLVWDTLPYSTSMSTQLIGAPVIVAAHWYGIIIGILVNLPSLYKIIKKHW